MVTSKKSQVRTRRLVLITGASTGIGRAAAVALAERGWRVLACARKPEDLRSLAESSPNIRAVPLDVVESKQIAAAVDDLRDELKHASEFSLINNAGIAVAGPLEALDINQFRQQFAVNVIGLLEVTQAFLPWIRETKGRVINISSVSGLASSPFMGAYSASKFAVESLSDALRREVMGFGVKVIVVEPGPIDTPIWNKGLGKKDQLKAGMNPDRLPLYEKNFLRFVSYIEKVARDAIPVSRVTDVLIRALESTNPPPRILVAAPRDRIRVRLAQLLPDSLMDTLIAKALLNPK